MEKKYKFATTLILYVLFSFFNCDAELYFSDAIAARFFTLAETEHTRLVFDEVPENESLGYFGFKGKTYPVFYLRGKTESSVQIAVKGEVYKADRRGRFEIPVRILENLTKLVIKAYNLQNEYSEYEVWIQYHVNPFTEADPLPGKISVSEQIEDKSLEKSGKWNLNPYYVLTSNFLNDQKSSYWYLGHRFSLDVLKDRNILQFSLNALLKNLSSLQTLGFNSLSAEYRFSFNPGIFSVQPGIFLHKSNIFSKGSQAFDWNNQVDFITYGLVLQNAIKAKYFIFNVLIRGAPFLKTQNGPTGSFLEGTFSFDINWVSDLKLSLSMGAGRVLIENSVNVSRPINQYFMGLGLKL